MANALRIGDHLAGRPDDLRKVNRPGPSLCPTRMDRTYSAIILAGGDGTRLRSVTRAIAGDDRPKQFCPILGEGTLLDQARRRVGLVVAPERTVISVTRTHERFYRDALADCARETIVAQPGNRGTAPAILYALLRLAVVAPGGATVILPSDHWVSDDAAFMARIEGALEAVGEHPDLVVLLGIDADRPEPEYGWIEPGDLVLGRSSWPVYRVRRFWEKPPRPVAERLMRAGCLWNSFVTVGAPAALRRLVRLAAPSLAAAFGQLYARLGTPSELEMADEVYASLSSVDFSRDILQVRPEHLAVLPVTGVAWNDLGSPERVRMSRAMTSGHLAMA